ncbi:MAG: 3-deoxy-8-phosphooctulonate synthase [Desulfobacteraceae bacterium]|nr:3-deoxy-8-phosphooctulonate synthase [Desulfobacteraceae bacterium]MBC2757071.1 3-deoxy-8-phosphooctulonate synthase [Desulfobacteraceae bacterium]MBC2763712.1 3-deoxy-8-phosphooctulonate synthase [ANME-2 cluster archaeon]
MVNPVLIKNVRIGRPEPFVLISGPCVIESEQTTYDIAAKLKKLTDGLNIPFIFKASYDKANRTSIDSFRGPGIEKGLEVLTCIRKDLGVPVISDVHQVSEVEMAAQSLDVIQIPAFLCRQTDLLVEAANTGKPINVKKGQFLAPWDMKNVVNKILSAGNQKIILTDRGVSFGYNNLVTDFRCIKIMHETGFPVIYDATHSVQLPGGAGTASAGQREFIPLLARAAIAAGADGLFVETHQDPEKALSDGPNAMRLDDMEDLLVQLKTIEAALT